MYYIGPALISLPAGTLADRWGVKRILVLGQIVIAVGLLAASTAHSYAAFILLHDAEHERERREAKRRRVSAGAHDHERADRD